MRESEDIKSENEARRSQLGHGRSARSLPGGRSLALREPRRSQSARSRGVSLLPRFARETTHAANYWEMVGRQVLLFVRSRRRKFFEAAGLRLAAREVSQRGGGARRGSEATA